MLKVYFGSLPNEIYVADKYFDINYDPDWLMDEMVKEMIKDIDKSEVVAKNIIESPILGTMPPQWLSGGVKCLICMLKDTNGFIFNGTNCGDNCSKWILKIAEIKDLTITFHHIMDFGKDTEFKCEILNNGTITNNFKEFVDEYSRW